MTVMSVIVILVMTAIAMAVMVLEQTAMEAVVADGGDE